MNLASNQPKRPESVTDLPSWETELMLGEIALTDITMKAGVLAVADDLVRVLQGAYRPDELVVRSDGARVVVLRPHTEAELAELLAKEQRSWDVRYGAGA